MIDLDRLSPPPPPDRDRDLAQRDELRRAWQTPRGWRRLSAVNNSVVGTW